MIRYKDYAITTDSEYPTVCRVTIMKSGKNKGEEAITPIYFPRDMLGAFTALQRITTTDATRDCKTLAAAIKAIDENHTELIKVLKEAL